MPDRADRIAALSPERRALLLRRLAHRPAPDERSTVRPQPRDGHPCRFPASEGQQRLWFLHELDPSSPAYVLPIVVGFRGELDVDALVRSIGWLADRHEALRTTYDVDQDGTVWQVVHGPGALAAPIGRETVDAAGLDGRIAALVARPFDLRAAAPLHGTVLDVRGGAHDRVLVLCVHHVAVDGWSLGVLVEDLQVAYPAFLAGAAPTVPAPALQYADYAVWQERGGGPPGDGPEFWRRRLRDTVPLRLPVDRQPQGMRSTRGDSVEVRLPAGLVARLDELAVAARSTRFMVLTAGLLVVLRRWTDQDDVVVCSPVAGRPVAELEQVVGFFVNTLPLRFDVRETQTFRELLYAVRDVCVEAYGHQDVSFDRIVRELGERHGGQPQLAQVLLALRNVRLRPLTLPGVTAEIVDVPSGGAQLELGIEFAPDADGALVGALEFSTDLFDRGSALRIAEALRTVFAAVADDADRPVWAVPVTVPGPDDPAPVRPGGAPDVVPAWFESTVDRVGDAVAVVADGTGEELTYRELDRRANRLARLLRARGVRPEDPVGVCLHRGVDLVVALLAVLKAGAVYAPLDPGYPAGRLATIVLDLAPALTLTGSALAGLLPAGGPGGATVRLDAVAGELAALPADRLPDAPSGDNAAYVFFTSGSTGRPKGVLGTHAGIANRVADMAGQIAAAPGERVLQKTPIGFDPSLAEILSPLVAGAVLVVAPADRHADPGYLVDAVERHGITSMDIVPSMLRLLLERPDLGARTTTLRRLFCGGEELSSALADAFRRTVPGARLVNAYGPTEAAVDVSSYDVPLPVPDRVPIGAPLAGVELLVLDRHGQRQPVGVPGRLVVGGVQLARGYLGAPGLTAERFVPHPFVPGARVYDTGDRARLLPDGTLQFLGRYDDQVKIRGTRIEPGEVEAALRDHPAVADAAVVTRGSGTDARLVAYVSPAGPGERAAAGSLRDALRDRLPAAMVPGTFQWVDEFPLTGTGKIDRAALPEPAAVVVADREPPDGDLEAVLAGLWAEILDVAEVGVLDDFFELGGHSLLATRIVARAGDLFRVELSLRAFVGASTVRDLAGLVRAASAAVGDDADRIAAIVLAVSVMSPDEVTAGLAGAGEG